jgi:hypothetical protein
MRILILSAALLVGIAGSAATAETGAIPKFPGVWENPGFDLAPNGKGGPGPVTNLAADIRQPQGDYRNPILRPWAAAIVKHWGDETHAGRAPLHPHALCLPTSVPGVMTLHGAYEFLQTPKEVTIIVANQAQVRHIYLDVPHSKHVTPSWYGESVGHYEGDTLVVDTIGIKTGEFTPMDRYGTPHTEKLHVVERIHMASLKELRIDYHFDDPGAFTTPWDAVVPFHPLKEGWDEEVCDESNVDPVTGKPIAHIPVAEHSDF